MESERGGDMADSSAYFSDGGTLSACRKVGYNLKHVGLAFSGAPFRFYHIKTASELHMYGIPNLLAEYKKLLSSTTIS